MVLKAKLKSIKRKCAQLQDSMEANRQPVSPVSRLVCSKGGRDERRAMNQSLETFHHAGVRATCQESFRQATGDFLGRGRVSGGVGLWRQTVTDQRSMVKTTASCSAHIQEQHQVQLPSWDSLTSHSSTLRMEVMLLYAAACSCHWRLCLNMSKETIQLLH